MGKCVSILRRAKQESKITAVCSTLQETTNSENSEGMTTALARSAEINFGDGQFES